MRTATGKGARLLVACATAMLLLSTGARSESPSSDALVDSAVPLAEPLAAYERALEKVALAGASEDPVAALASLADVASPRLVALRDQLADHPHPRVQAALLTALVDMGDRSPAVSLLAERALLSSDAAVVDQASTAVSSAKLPVRFAAIWDPRTPAVLWMWHANRGGALGELLVGVAAVRPWQDPAWDVVPHLLRARLLARAGTREAVELLRDELVAHDELGRFHLPVPEAADPGLLRELLADPAPAFRSYAARSLAAVGLDDDLHGLLADPSEAVVTAAAAALLAADDPRVLAEVEGAIRAGTTREVAVHGVSLSHLGVDAERHLSSDALLLLVPEDRVPSALGAVRELDRRGESLSSRQLLGLDPVAVSRRLDPAAVRRIGAGLVLRAVARDRAFDLLPRVVELALADEPAFDLTRLPDELWSWPHFLLELPAPVAGQCVRSLEAWLQAQRSNQALTWDDRSPNQPRLFAALQVLGTAARGENAERLWRRFRNAENPLEDPWLTIPVLWGASERSEELRRAVRPSRRWLAPWRRRMPSAGPELPSPRDRTQPPWGNPCGAGVTERVVPPPTLPGRVRALWGRLASPLEPAYDDPDRLRLDLLALRCGDLDDVKPLTEDPRRGIREQAWALVPALAREDRTAWPAAPLVLPGPTLSPEDRAWLEQHLAALRSKRAGELAAFIRGGEPRTADGPADWLGVEAPSWLLMQEGVGLAAEMRVLLQDPVPKVRHAAAWALWRLLGEQLALDVLLRDAAGEDQEARAGALHALLAMRHRPAASLFPPLLTERDPRLRELGLVGVAVLRIQGALPEVMNLVTDEQPRVAAAAVRALGELHPPAAFRLLLELASHEQPGVFAPPAALGLYHDAEQVDAVLERLAEEADGRTRVGGLTQALLSMTFRLFPLERGLFGPSGTPDRRLVAEQVAWWQQHRSMTLAERARSFLTGEVATALEGNDSEAAAACQRLEWFLDLDCSRQPWRREERDKLCLVRELLERGEVWQALSWPFGNRFHGLELLEAVDPARTRRMVLEPMWKPARGTFDPNHALLVRLAGVDLGDPAVAVCQHRAEVLSRWHEWARAEGWLP